MPSVRKMPVLLLVVCAAAAVAAAWWWTKPARVEIVHPIRGEAAEVVYATGVVEPRLWAKVAPLARDRIVEICDCEGRRVTKGEVLARLDDRQARAAVVEAEARDRLARSDLDRVARLADRATASRQDLDRARAEAAQAEARVVALRAALEDRLVRAPIDGVVLRRDGEVGELAGNDTVLFWVGEPRPLRVVADVDEEHVPKLAVGERALVASDAFPGRALEARVDRITPKGDPVAKTWRVYLSLPDDTPLLVGMTVDVDVVTRVVADALTVPAEAVAGDRVAIVEGDRLRLVAVRIGIRDARRVEVVGGLEPAARVVTPYPLHLADRARVVSGEHAP